MRKNQKGFTLVELMVVLAILGIIVVGVLGLVTRQNKAYHSEEAIIDMQMSNRVAMDRLVHLIRMAGFGCQKNISNGVNGFTTVITATNSSTSPDTLTVVSGLRRIGVVTDSNDADGDGVDTPDEEYPPSTTIKVTTDNNSLSDYFDDSSTPYKQYFYISPVTNRNYLTIAASGVTSTTLTKTGGNITVNEGDIVYAVRPYTLAINGGNLTINDGPSNQVYAENIEDLQFQYGWDANTDGRITAAEWVNNPAGSEDKVRAVKIFLLARTANPDRKKDYTDKKIYTLAGVAVGPFNDHFHRYLMETTVFIRNLNF